MEFYFLWEYIRHILDSERIELESLSDLRRRITAAIAAVLVDMQSRVWGEMK
jgi:hypothetical protein